MQKLIFSSDELPAHFNPTKRAIEWSNALLHGGYNGEAIIPDKEIRFNGLVELSAPSGTMIATSSANSLILKRNHEHIVRDMDDRIMLFFNTGKSDMRVVQLGKETFLGPNEGILLTQEFPQILDGSKSGEVVCLILPREPYDEWIDFVDDFIGTKGSINNSRFQLLKNYCCMLVCEANNFTDCEINAITNHISKLASFWLGAKIIKTERSEQSAISARRLAINRIIRRNLNNAELDVKFIARKLQLSPRMVQHILTKSGTNFISLLHLIRQNRALKMLYDPAYADMSLEKISFFCGYNDYSNFYKNFIQFHKTSPQVLRANEALKTLK
ncbi:helix-turn-helix domain-containing protein [Pseudaquidulcibacter saccharophilus]|uniref:helix-turn-helix domain-containing protein n=1 Tax=Pseudaquidulcibacter saccharophilus TaxID=2831900 RepID=UPI001EFF4F6B|nr:helix-turn-helix domain-containing protein [Pseudaquidulcibacter saccharophilus]